MALFLSLVVGLLFTGAIYQMLSGNFLRILIGLVLISNAANLSVFVAGGLDSNLPALIPLETEALVEPVANALPQALVLTAIVIGFGLFSFALFLALRAFRDLGDLDGNSEQDT